MYSLFPPCRFSGTQQHGVYGRMFCLTLRNPSMLMHKTRKAAWDKISCRGQAEGPSGL